MTVIALSHELGTHSEATGRRIAEQLRIRHRIMEPPALSPSGAPAIRLSRPRDDREDVAAALTKEIAALALEGDVVIQGCLAPAVLHSVGHVIRVRLFAPLQFRARAAQAELEGADEASAAKLIRRSDAAQATLVEDCFGLDIRSPAIYDAVLNVQRLGFEACADFVCRLARQPEFQPTVASRIVLSGLVDPSATLDDGPCAGAEGASPYDLDVAPPASAHAFGRNDDRLHEQLRQAESALYERLLPDHGFDYDELELQPLKSSKACRD